MKSVLVTVLGLVLVSQAQATREVVKCISTAKGPKVSLSMNFDPSVSIDTVWAKDAQGRSTIIPTKIGDRDADGFTTAKVEMNIPKNYFRSPEFTGTYVLAGFYSVNMPEEKGSGYSDDFDGGPYTSFHGFDKDDSWDIIAYLAAPEVRQANKTYKGLMTVQPNFVDQGYLHIPMTCSSSFAN